MFVDLFDNFDFESFFPKRPDDARLTNRFVEESNGVKLITEVWEKDNYKFTETKFVYETKPLEDNEIVEQLRIELKAAVSSENFELASYLRDEIAKLTSKKE